MKLEIRLELVYVGFCRLWRKVGFYCLEMVVDRVIWFDLGKKDFFGYFVGSYFFLGNRNRSRGLIVFKVIYKNWRFNKE